MQQLFEVRKIHGDIYATVFEDGFLVPWKPLSIGDYIKYNKDRDRGLIPHSQLEDEIFKKCVQSDAVLRQMDFIKAGIVTTVVANIWRFSGPTGVDDFHDDLDAAREILFSHETRALHDLVQIISIAFPYKPEEIYDMSYEVFLLRLAQSEKKLLEMGLFLKEPISLQVPEQKKHSKLGKIEQPAVDAKKLWDQQQSQKTKSAPHNRVQSQDKWWDKSPVLEATNKHNIDFDIESTADNGLVLDNDERASHPEVQKAIIESKTSTDRAKLVEDAKWIYKDLIEELAKRKKR